MTVAAKKTASEGKAKKAVSKKPRTLKQVLKGVGKVRGVSYYFGDDGIELTIDGEAKLYTDKSGLLAELLQAIGAKPAGA